MAGITARHNKYGMTVVSRGRNLEQYNQSCESLDVLDLDFDELFISVSDFNEADIDVQGNLILEHFVDDQMLAEEGIPLTCEDMRNIFNTRSILNNQENLKAG
ncbi:MAG: hypothetical protein VX619_02870 [bacterium]|nr:hypothetical protein [bacterium]